MSEIVNQGQDVLFLLYVVYNVDQLVTRTSSLTDHTL